MKQTPNNIFTGNNLQNFIRIFMCNSLPKNPRFLCSATRTDTKLTCNIKSCKLKLVSQMSVNLFVGNVCFFKLLQIAYHALISLSEERSHKVICSQVVMLTNRLITVVDVPL